MGRIRKKFSAHHILQATGKLKIRKNPRRRALFIFILEKKLKIEKWPKYHQKTSFLGHFWAKNPRDQYFDRKNDFFRKLFFLNNPIVFPTS